MPRMLRDVNPAERDLGTATGGVWTTADARAAGLSDDHVRSRVSRGLWQSPRRGTFCDGGVVPDPVMRAAAAVLVARRQSRRAVAIGRTAARVWGLPLVDDDDPATGRYEIEHDDVWVSSGQTRNPTLHSRRTVLPAEEVGWVRGVPVQSLRSTVAELASALRPDALVCVIDHVLHSGVMTHHELERLLDRRAGHPGVCALRAALAVADPLAESPHETLTRLLLKPLLPGLRSQVRVRDGAGRVIARFDLGDEHLRLGVESDGAAAHRGRAAQDRRRDFRTGWSVERCTWYETRCEQAQLVQRVLQTASRLGRAA